MENDGIHSKSKLVVLMMEKELFVVAILHLASPLQDLRHYGVQDVENVVVIMKELGLIATKQFEVVVNYLPMFLT